LKNLLKYEIGLILLLHCLIFTQKERFYVYMHMGDIISDNSLYAKRQCYTFIYFLPNKLSIWLQVSNLFVLALLLSETFLVESLIELYIKQSNV